MTHRPYGSFSLQFHFGSFLRHSPREFSLCSPNELSPQCQGVIYYNILSTATLGPRYILLSAISQSVAHLLYLNNIVLCVNTFIYKMYMFMLMCGKMCSCQGHFDIVYYCHRFLIFRMILSHIYNSSSLNIFTLLQNILYIFFDF